MKIYFFIISLVAIIISVSGCKRGNSSSFADNEITLATIELSRDWNDSIESRKMSCNIKVNFTYPTESKKYDLRSLQSFFTEVLLGYEYREELPIDATNKYIDDKIKKYRQSVERVVSSKEFIEENNEVYNYNVFISDSITFNSEGLISLQVNTLTERGADNLFTSTLCYTLDLKKGDPLSETDIFITDYEDALRTIFIRKILEKNGAENINELEEHGFFGIEEISPNSNFIVNNRGITYIFNRGEYSAYILPAIHIELPFNEIRELLLEKSPLATILVQGE